MLNLSTYTKLDFKETLKRAVRYFTEQEKLHLVELIGHFHGDEGACEIRVSGKTIASGDEKHDAEEVLASTTRYLVEKYGVNLVYEGLHLHAGADNNAGHLVVAVHHHRLDLCSA